MQAFKTALDNERAVEGYYDSMLAKFNALPAAQSVDRVNKLMDAFSSPDNGNIHKFGEAGEEVGYLLRDLITSFASFSGAECGGG